LGEGVAVTLKHDGHKMLIYTKDYGLSPHLALFGEWERAIEEVVKRLLPEKSTAIEVGSKMGYHTLSMAAKIGTEGTLYCFEANPEMFRLLNWTIELNGYKDRIQLKECAALDKEGLVEFGYDPTAVGGGHVNAVNQPVMLQVKTVTLDSLDIQGPVAMIRIDAEGAEPLIIKGAKDIIRRSDDIKLICEWSIDMMKQNIDVTEYVNSLNSMGFKFWRINHDSNLISVPPSEMIALPHCEIVMCRRALT